MRFALLLLPLAAALRMNLPRAQHIQNYAARMKCVPSRMLHLGDPTAPPLFEGQLVRSDCVPEDAEPFDFVYADEFFRKMSVPASRDALVKVSKAMSIGGVLAFSDHAVRPAMDQVLKSAGFAAVVETLVDDMRFITAYKSICDPIRYTDFREDERPFAQKAPSKFPVAFFNILELTIQIISAYVLGTLLAQLLRYWFNM